MVPNLIGDEVVFIFANSMTETARPLMQIFRNYGLVCIDMCATFPRDQPEVYTTLAGIATRFVIVPSVDLAQDETLKPVLAALVRRGQAFKKEAIILVIDIIPWYPGKEIPTTGQEFLDELHWELCPYTDMTTDIIAQRVGRLLSKFLTTPAKEKGVDK